MLQVNGAANMTSAGTSRDASGDASGATVAPCSRLVSKLFPALRPPPPPQILQQQVRTGIRGLHLATPQTLQHRYNTGRYHIDG